MLPFQSCIFFAWNAMPVLKAAVHSVLLRYLQSHGSSDNIYFWHHNKCIHEYSHDTDSFRYLMIKFLLHQQNAYFSPLFAKTGAYSAPALLFCRFVMLIFFHCGRNKIINQPFIFMSGIEKAQSRKNKSSDKINQ